MSARKWSVSYIPCDELICRDDRIKVPLYIRLSTKILRGELRCRIFRARERERSHVWDNPSVFMREDNWLSCFYRIYYRTIYLMRVKVWTFAHNYSLFCALHRSVPIKVLNC